MTFATKSAERTHDLRFFVEIDGLPIVFCDHSKVFLDVEIKGDLNGVTEYMRAYVDDVQIGGDLSSGYQDDTFRYVIEDEEITETIKGSFPIKLQAWGSAAVTASGSWTNSIRFTFKLPDGTTQQYTLDDAQAGATITSYAKQKQYAECLHRESVGFGSSRLNLADRKQVGGSASISLIDLQGSILSDLFSARNRNETWIAADIAPADPSVNVKDASRLSANQVYYIGTESIWIESLGVSSITAMARGQFDSTAQSHFGDAEETIQSAAIYSKAPSWRGRRLNVKAGYLNEDGKAVGNIDTIARLRIENAPKFLGFGKWEINCADLVDFFTNRRAYEGMIEHKAKGEVLPGRTLPLNSTGQWSVAGTDSTYAWVKAYAADPDDDDDLFIGIVNFTLDGTDLEFGYEDLLMPGGFNSSPGQFILPQMAKRVAYLTGDPVDVVLRILLSVTGNLSNHGTYDTLAGADRTQFGDHHWRIGAAIPASDVDVAAFEDLRGSDMKWTLLLHEPLKVADLLNQFCLSARAFWYVKSDGSISVKRLKNKESAADATSTLTVDDSLMLTETADATTLDETGIAAIVTLRTNFDPLRNEFATTVNSFDGETLAKHHEADATIEIEGKYWTVDGPTIQQQPKLKRHGSVSFEIVQTHLRRIQKSLSRGTITHEAICAWPAITVNVGDVVTLTNSQAPTFEGATFSSSKFIVIEKRPDAGSGKVTLGLIFRDKAWLISPSGTISAYNSGTTTITFDASDSEWAGTDPTDHFFVGQDIYIYDVGSNRKGAATIGSITNATVMILSAAPGAFTPAAGDICFSLGYGNAATANGLGHTVDIDCIFQVVDGTLGAGKDDGTRWS